MFWKKKNENKNADPLNSLEYEKCLKRFVELNTAIETLKVKYENLETGLSSLRGKFNQRARGERNRETDEETQQEEKYINNEVPIG